MKKRTVTVSLEIKSILTIKQIKELIKLAAASCGEIKQIQLNSIDASR